MQPISSGTECLPARLTIVPIGIVKKLKRTSIKSLSDSTKIIVLLPLSTKAFKLITFFTLLILINVLIYRFCCAGNEKSSPMFNFK
ncbi:unnamed protein product, partial [Prunus brigantina]